MESSDKIKFKCPECGKKLAADVSFAGKKARCLRCNNLIDIPSTDSLDEDMPLANEVQDTAEWTRPPSVPTRRKRLITIGVAVALVLGVICLVIIIHNVTSEDSLSPKQAKEQRVRKVVEDFLEGQKKGEYGTRYFTDEYCATRFFALTNWEILSCDVYDTSAKMIVRIDSSNKAGIPIRVNWEFGLEATKCEGWKIWRIKKV